MTHFNTCQILELAAVGTLQIPLSQRTRRALHNLSENSWKEIDSVLTEHRLQFMAWHGLRQAGLTDAVPSNLRAQRAEEAKNAQLRDAFLQMSLTRLSSYLEEEDVQVLVCKGIRLTEQYYPARGLRPMQDMDFWLLDPRSLSNCTAALERAGFSERPHKATRDARNFIDDAGVVLDVHLRMRVLEETDHRLVDLAEPQDDSPLWRLIPEALVAHLLVHLLGHANKSGIVLCWLFDLALVLRNERLDLGKLKRLLPENGTWLVFLRTVKSFRAIGWLEDSLGLDDELNHVRTISWSNLVRQRRRANWSGLRGKMRLGRLFFRGDVESIQVMPSVSDLIWVPVDLFLEEGRLLHGPGALLISRDES